MWDIRLRLEGFDGDNIILVIKGDSKYKDKKLYLSPKDFVEFLKFLKAKKDLEFLIEMSNDSSIEAYKKFLK